jgi:hypothetical protein
MAENLVENLDITRVLFQGMQKKKYRSFITKHTAIDEEKFEIYRLFIFWVIPIYKSVKIVVN